MKEFLYAENHDYNSEFVVKGMNSVTLGCYNCSHMKQHYPKGFHVICQIGKGNTMLGDIKCSGCTLPAYSLDYSLLYRSVGYIQVGSNDFAVIKKSNAVFLFVYFLSVIAAAVLMAFCLTDYSGAFAENVKNESLLKKEIVLPYKMTTKMYIDTENTIFEMPQQQEIRFKANQRLQSYAYSNQKVNPYYVVVRISTEDGQIIYESDFIPPGSALQKIELNQVMEEGEYSCVIRFFTYSFDSEIRNLDIYEYHTKIIFN